MPAITRRSSRRSHTKPNELTCDPSITKTDTNPTIDLPTLDVTELDNRLLCRRAIFKPNAVAVSVLSRFDSADSGSVPMYNVRLANNTTMAVFWHELSVM